MSAQTQESSNIGLLNERHLHAALKRWYVQPNDRLEAPVDGFVVDIVRDDLLIEIQTGNFSSVKRKLQALVARHPVRLIYPIAREKWIVKLGEGGGGRRKSPKRGRIEEVFGELVSFPKLLLEENFALEVLFTQEEEVRRYDGRRGWRRRGWVIEQRRLLGVVGQWLFERPGDMRALLPQRLPRRFTTADLAEGIEKPRWLAQKMAYCLREMEVIVEVGRRGRSLLYSERSRRSLP